MTTPSIGFLPFPHVLRIEPTSQCDLSCSHCPTGTVQTSRYMMTKKIFEKVLHQINLNRNLINVIVLYHGGESLLHRDIYEMIGQLKSINNSFFIKTVSNGMALTRKNSEQIINSGLDAIEFSLDGESPSENQYIREKSNTKKIIKNINEFIELKAFLNTIKPDIYISTTQFLRRGTQIMMPETPPVPAWLEQLFQGKISGFKSTYALQWPHMGDSGKFELLEFDGQDRNYCDHITNTLTIRADGSIVPCCYDLTSKLVMGNIIDINQSLFDIWNGYNYQILRQSIQLKKYISICNTCAVVRPPKYLVPKWQ